MNHDRTTEALIWTGWAVGLLLLFVLLAAACSGYDRPQPADTLTEPLLALVPDADTARFRAALETAGATPEVWEVIYSYGVLDRPAAPPLPPPPAEGECVGFVGVSTTGEIATGWYERAYPGADVGASPETVGHDDCSTGVVPGPWLYNSGPGPGVRCPPTICAETDNSFGGIGRCTMDTWAGLNARCWGTVDSVAVLVGPYSGLIWTPIFRDPQSATLQPGHRLELDAVLAELRARHPGAAIYPSMMRIDSSCPAYGSNGRAITQQSVDYLVQQHGLERGPTFVLPADASYRRDGCHANERGRASFADTLAAWLAR